MTVVPLFVTRFKVEDITTSRMNEDQTVNTKLEKETMERLSGNNYDLTWFTVFKIVTWASF